MPSGGVEIGNPDALVDPATAAFQAASLTNSKEGSTSEIELAETFAAERANTAQASHIANAERDRIRLYMNQFSRIWVKVDEASFRQTRLEGKHE